MRSTTRVAWGAATILFVGMMSGSALADDKDLAACTEIENSIDRLACFDAAAKARGVASPEVDTSQPADAGQWQLRTETSKVDDSTNVYVEVDSSNTVEDNIGRDTNARLTLRCLENHTDVVVWLAGHWYSDREDVTTRIDKRKAVSQAWYEGHDQQFMFHPAAVAFIKQMMTGKELFLRTAPVNDPYLELTFPIAGLANAIKPLQKACHWN